MYVLYIKDKHIKLIDNTILKVIRHRNKRWIHCEKNN